jgi:hypothetical protein
MLSTAFYANLPYPPKTNLPSIAPVSMATSFTRIKAKEALDSFQPIRQVNPLPLFLI